MHRSALTEVLIDVPAADYDATVAFWAAATGAEPKQGVQHPEYTKLLGRHGIGLMIQRLGAGGPRLHLDITAEDVAAETARLTALGATEVEAVEDWQVLRDPAGNEFCVVPADPGDLTEADSVQWP